VTLLKKKRKTKGESCKGAEKQIRKSTQRYDKYKYENKTKKNIFFLSFFVPFTFSKNNK
jgi:hypothetical protein